MVIPLEITSKVTQNFSLLYMVKVLTIDLYRVKGSLGSRKCNAQVFTLDFVEYEPVSRQHIAGSCCCGPSVISQR